MQFKTSEQIRAEKEASGKSAKKEAARAEKLAEKSSRKYARMAEESAKREAARKKKPPLVIRPGVIEAPALKAAKAYPVFDPNAPGRIVPGTKKESDDQRARVKAQETRAKQVWNATTKQWVKPNP